MYRYLFDTRTPQGTLGIIQMKLLEGNTNMHAVGPPLCFPKDCVKVDVATVMSPIGLWTAVLKQVWHLVFLGARSDCGEVRNPRT